jgi:prepilin-type N-terminal cleavage/methylation domain-containing protein
MKKFLKNHWSSVIGHRSFQQKGFTIAEMLIVIIILGTLMGIGTRTYYRERDRYEFNQGLIKVMGIIKTTRNFAATSYPIYVGGGTTPTIPVDGYGIHIDLTPDVDQPHFTVFGNTGTEENQFDLGDEILETYRLPQIIEFFSFFYNDEEKYDPGNSKPTETEAVIIFKPPLAETYLGDNSLLKMDELRLKFHNPIVPPESIKEYQCIIINAVKTFPEIIDGNCT